MMKSEFEKLTGIFPTDELYKQIEAAYYTYSGDKVHFCKAYTENKDGLAERIQHDADLKARLDDGDYARKIDTLEGTIAKLKEQLEREQEWKPYIDKDNFEQSCYEHLRSQKDAQVLTDEEAKDLLYEEFGFAREKVKIYREIPKLEVNRHRTLRKVGTIERLPLYCATDWNYIRFDCGCMAYELVNDQLRPVVH